MECRDAQFYLRLRRHAADELGSDVTGALDGHLAGCVACARDARAALSFDRAVASAMRAVPVPAGLREALVTQAAAQHGAILRRKLARGAAACAAALVLLAIGLGVFSSTRPKLDTDDLVHRADQLAMSPEDSLRHWLAEQKLPPDLPRPFDPTLLVWHTIAKVQDRDVPVLVFHSSDPNDKGFALVYIFPENGRFDLKELRDAQASNARAEVLTGPGVPRGFAYVCVYTTHTLEPFLRTRNGGERGA